MTIVDIILSAIGALRRNVLITLLTVLAVTIGVSFVIILPAASEGRKAGVTERIRGLGSNLMFVRPGSTTAGGASQLPGTGPSLFYEDALAINAANLEYIEGIAAQVTAGGPGAIFPAQVIYRGGNVSTTLVGTEPSYQFVRDFYVESGRFISDDDISKKALTTVLGANVREKLFGDKDPVGETVRIAVGPGNFAIGFNFTVIGVMETKGASTTGDQDDLIFVPMPSFQARVPFIRNPRGLTNVSQINIKLEDGANAERAEQEIGAILLERHSVNEPDFTIQTQSDLADTATDVQKQFDLLGKFMAGVSLFVGGILVMTIMLVSVTERTREIGIHKALGAKQRDILVQFIAEALTVTLAGGLLGVLAGIGVTRALERWKLDFDLPLLLWSPHISVGETPFVVTPFYMVVGVAASLAVGLAFGVYPAWRASRLDPIVALRHE